MSAPAAELSGATLLAWFDELVKDAQVSPRPNAWERQFLADQYKRRMRFQERFDLWPQQMEVLRQIEEKIHAAG